jgi:hypothetical protein
MSKQTFQSFEEFWPFYVSQHMDAKTRQLHFAGTAAALTAAAGALITGRKALWPLAFVAGYGPAWASHFFVENNRPATFKFPIYSLAADFVMFGKMIAGTMDAEVEKVRFEAAAPVVPGTTVADISVN